MNKPYIVVLIILNAFESFKCFGAAKLDDFR